MLYRFCESVIMIGLSSVRCQSTVGPLSVHCRSVISPLSFRCQSTVGPLSVHCRSVIVCGHPFFFLLWHEVWTRK